ncbi:MAG TPA: ATP-binding protein, partial [Planctomycetota bacterium]|nr:ATP-binding protein [Planctomycetota bacterium]
RGLQLAQIDVGELARVVFDELMVAHGNRSVALAVTEMPPAHGDLSMLHEAMTNLLANALKFTSQNPKARIEVGGRIDADRHEHVYYVRDNGVGFDPKYAHRLFRVFQRLHSDEAFEGTGVGLAIVQRILERHGGRTWAEGAVGQGATFYFALPATARATPAPEFAQPEYAAQEARA